MQKMLLKKPVKFLENFSFGEFKVDKNYVNMLHKLASKRIPKINN